MPKPKKNKPLKKGLRSSLVVPLVVSLVLFTSTGVYNSRPEELSPNLASVLSQVAEATIEESRPRLIEGAVLLEALTARGVYVFDLDSGEILFTKDPENPVLPASTTKLATALVALKDYNLEDVVTVRNINGISGNRMGLFNGEKITVLDLLKGLLIYSANDAAYALADHNPGGKTAFMVRMNEVAAELGLTKTHFTNPAGFDEYLHFSTAKDMGNLAFQAIQNETVSAIVQTQETQVKSTDGRMIHKLTNTNHLLGKTPGVIGIKTGTTITSGESLITLVDRENKKVILSVLGSTDRFGETEKLIDWIYSNYVWGESNSVTQ